MSRLAGKIAIVTGASRGIGRAIAEAFAREGARIAICGRKQDALEEVARHHPGVILPVQAHVGKAEDIDRLVAETEKAFGPPDILVNNAATNIAQGPCLEFDEAQFDKMVEVNMKSTFRLVSRVAPGMIQRRSGSIINMASVAGIRPQPHSMLYSMTKAALVMMTMSYALEFGPSGVRVNAIAPGLIQTALSEYFWKHEDRRKYYLERQPLQHLGQPREIADIAVMLASDESSYMTGQTIVVDGGLLMA
jgi:NAD(P)-dependent dehydrogenase (short-subunit alcohol dehydrogenase family)